jgi:microcompartment protein CcmL/EutN
MVAHFLGQRAPFHSPLNMLGTRKEFEEFRERLSAWCMTNSSAIQLGSVELVGGGGMVVVELRSIVAFDEGTVEAGTGIARDAGRHVAPLACVVVHTNVEGELASSNDTIMVTMGAFCEAALEEYTSWINDSLHLSTYTKDALVKCIETECRNEKQSEQWELCIHRTV